jgi:hypothetical protein
MKAFLVSFVFLGLVTLLSPGRALTQIEGQIEANIPFPFYVGNAKFPPGDYIIRRLSVTDGSMEISSPDSRISALFVVRQSQATATPSSTELVFDKYGNHFVLSKLYDQENRFGAALEASRYQEKFAGESPNSEERHVAAKHQAAQ